MRLNGVLGKPAPIRTLLWLRADEGVVGDGIDGDGSSLRADPDRGRKDGASGQGGGRDRGDAIEGMSSAVAVTGPYDVIAVVEAASIDALGKMVVSRIQDVKRIGPHPHLSGRAHLTRGRL